MGADYYRHSGKFSTAGVVKTLALGSLAASVFGAIYAYAILYIPLAGTVSFLLSGGYGLVTGVCAGLLLKSGLIRNRKIGWFCLLFCQLVGYYVTWAVWIHAMIARAGGDLGLGILFFPPVLVQAILKVNEVGAWSIGSGGEPVSGVLLWLFWLGEVVIIFGACLVGLSQLDEPFCESCRVWCKEHSGVAALHPMAPEDLRQVLEHRQYECLELAQEPSEMSLHVQLDLHQCPQCQETCSVTGRLVTTTVKDGNKTTQSEKAVNQLLISRDEATALRNLHLLEKAQEESPPEE